MLQISNSESEGLTPRWVLRCLNTQSIYAESIFMILDMSRFLFTASDGQYNGQLDNTYIQIYIQAQKKKMQIRQVFIYKQFF